MCSPKKCSKKASVCWSGPCPRMRLHIKARNLRIVWRICLGTEFLFGARHQRVNVQCWWHCKKSSWKRAMSDSDILSRPTRLFSVTKYGDSNVSYFTNPNCNQIASIISRPHVGKQRRNQVWDYLITSFKSIIERQQHIQRKSQQVLFFLLIA